MSKGPTVGTRRVVHQHTDEQDDADDIVTERQVVEPLSDGEEEPDMIKRARPMMDDDETPEETPKVSKKSVEGKKKQDDEEPRKTRKKESVEETDKPRKKKTDSDDDDEKKQKKKNMDSDDEDVGQRKKRSGSDEESERKRERKSAGSDEERGKRKRKQGSDAVSPKKSKAKRGEGSKNEKEEIASKKEQVDGSKKHKDSKESEAISTTKDTDKNDTPKGKEKETEEEGMWTCDKCHHKTPTYDSDCQKCGVQRAAYRDEEKPSETSDAGKTPKPNEKSDMDKPIKKMHGNENEEMKQEPERPLATAARDGRNRVRLDLNDFHREDPRYFRKLSDSRNTLHIVPFQPTIGGNDYTCRLQMLLIHPEWMKNQLQYFGQRLRMQPPQAPIGGSCFLWPYGAWKIVNPKFKSKLLTPDEKMIIDGPDNTPDEHGHKYMNANTCEYARYKVTQCDKFPDAFEIDANHVMDVDAMRSEFYLYLEFLGFLGHLHLQAGITLSMLWYLFKTQMLRQIKAQIEEGTREKFMDRYKLPFLWPKEVYAMKLPGIVAPEDEKQEAGSGVAASGKCFSRVKKNPTVFKINAKPNKNDELRAAIAAKKYGGAKTNTSEPKVYRQLADDQFLDLEVGKYDGEKSLANWKPWYAWCENHFTMERPESSRSQPFYSEPIFHTTGVTKRGTPFETRGVSYKEKLVKKEVSMLANPNRKKPSALIQDPRYINSFGKWFAEGFRFNDLPLFNIFTNQITPWQERGAADGDFISPYVEIKSTCLTINSKCFCRFTLGPQEIWKGPSAKPFEPREAESHLKPLAATAELLRKKYGSSNLAITVDKVHEEQRRLLAIESAEGVTETTTALIVRT